MKMRMLLCLVLLLSQFSFVLAGRPNPISWEEKQVLQQVYPHIDALYAKSQYSNAHKVSWNAIKNMVRNMGINNDYTSSNTQESMRARFGYELYSYMSRLDNPLSLDDVEMGDIILDGKFTDHKKIELSRSRLIDGTDVRFIDAHISYIYNDEYKYISSISPFQELGGFGGGSRSSKYTFSVPFDVPVVRVTYTDKYGKKTGSDLYIKTQ